MRSSWWLGAVFVNDQTEVRRVRGCGDWGGWWREDEGERIEEEAEVEVGVKVEGGSRGTWRCFGSWKSERVLFQSARTRVHYAPPSTSKVRTVVRFLTLPGLPILTGCGLHQIRRVIFDSTLVVLQLTNTTEGITVGLIGSGSGWTMNEDSIIHDT